ncbi:hypothetical protein WJX75_005385 [Coccomyxa subellipsoidea]|uniref:Chlorophyll a-b binding protein, chloroplastic n=1 Tax=Coccomyxa subellipsoidea TaxID=248742 RepID=A0ABR2YLI7_9CHLO
MQSSLGVRFLAIQHSKPGIVLPRCRLAPLLQLTGPSTVPLIARLSRKRHIKAGASEGTEEGAMAPASSTGYPLRFPNPWLAAAIAFGLGQLIILALNDALLPGALRDLYYSIGGRAAGLLHPFSPKGKLLWRGEEAMGAALELLAVANAHRERLLQQQCSAPDTLQSPAHRQSDTLEDGSDFESTSMPVAGSASTHRSGSGEAQGWGGSAGRSRSCGQRPTRGRRRLFLGC